jgi:serine/threonine protein kinase
MKSVNKEAIEKGNQSLRLINERKIMSETNFPFIVQLRYAFQTSEKLYMIMDFINGGELFFHLRKEKRFTEEKTRFYSAEILLALNYLHSIEIVYRDLKPENILLDSDGHIKLTDFGLSKKFFSGNEKTFSLCGTPEYLAPEILQCTGHNNSVDYWSLGILIYEMLSGNPPFHNKNLENLFNDIVNKPITMKSYFSNEASSLLKALLEPNVICK